MAVCLWGLWAVSTGQKQETTLINRDGKIYTLLQKLCIIACPLSFWQWSHVPKIKERAAAYFSNRAEHHDTWRWTDYAEVGGHMSQPQSKQEITI